MKAVDLLLRKYAKGSHADDIRQIAAIAQWQASRTYDPAKGAIEPYMARAVMFAIIDELRRMNRRGPTVESNDDMFVCPAEPPTDVPSRIHPLLVAFHVYGRSLDEIAATQGVSRGTVWRRLNKERSKCKL